MSTVIHYLAYGSNLLPRRLQLRVPSARVLGVVTITGHRLRFHKKGQDGSAKCDAHATGDAAHRLHGAVYAMHAGERHLLDAVEGLGNGYDLREEQVTLDGCALTVFFYVAARPYIEDGLLPFDWYKELVAHGARAHGFPANYIAEIDAHPACSDADPHRAQLHFDMLPTGGA